MYFPSLVERVAIRVQVVEVVHVVRRGARVGATPQRTALTAGDLHVVVFVALVEHDLPVSHQDETVYVAVVPVSDLRREIGERGHFEPDIGRLGARPDFLAECCGDGAEQQEECGEVHHDAHGWLLA